MKVDVFFDSIKKLGLFKSLNTDQVAGMNAILCEWDQRLLTDLRQLAYILATAYHETGYRMQAVEEIGKGKGRPYGGFRKRSGIIYNEPHFLYYGRGLVQITWYENYELMGRLLHIDLLNKPELALNIDTAVQIMFEGMLKASSNFGDFIGRCLEMYFNATTCDWFNARKIINGTDCAQKIGDYAKLFYTALLQASSTIVMS